MSANSTELLIESIETFKPDFILLAGYLKKIEENVIRNFAGRMFNSHPSLLPKYGGHGMYGSNVHKQVFQNKEKISGVTIHEVNEEFDQGRIVFQQPIDIQPCKSWEEVESLVKSLEKEFLVDCLNRKKVEWTGG
jgi:phosphoribosylglycinamide formyltransferase-1